MTIERQSRILPFVNSTVAHTRDGLAFNGKVLSFYLIAAGLCVAAGIVWALLRLPFQYIAIILGLPAVLFIVMRPKLALFQFVFFVFIEYPLVPSIPLYIVDASTLLVIVAGCLDYMLNGRFPKRLPPMSLNYIYFVFALAICGIFSYWPSFAFRQVATFSIIVATFFALYRLMGRVSIHEVVRFFVALAVLHSAYVLVPFVISGGELRSFGLARAIFGHMAMIALPVSVGLYLGSRRKHVWPHLVGILTIMGGLIATHSRAPIAFGVISSLFIILAIRSRVKKAEFPSEDAKRYCGRIRVIVWAVVLATIGLVSVKLSVLETVLDRFGELFSAEPTGTFRWRLILWKKALLAFADHPVFGVGVGGYKHLHELYPYLRFTEAFTYLRIMSAHNLILHYLAETGLVGGLGVVCLFANKFRLARRGWLNASSGASLALYGAAFLFLISTFIDAAWLYGQLSFLAVFFAALIARQYSRTMKS